MPRGEEETSESKWIENLATSIKKKREAKKIIATAPREFVEEYRVKPVEEDRADPSKMANWAYGAARGRRRTRSPNRESACGTPRNGEAASIPHKGEC